MNSLVEASSRGETRGIRIGGAAGIAFFVLSFVGTNIVPVATLDLSASPVRDFFVDNGGRVRVREFLMIAALGFFLCWLGSLWSAMRKAGHTLSIIAFGAGLMMATLLAGAEVLFALPGEFKVSELDDATMRSLAVAPEIGVSLAQASVVFRTVLVGAVALAVLRHRGFPRWLGWSSGVLAVLTAIGSLAFLEPSGPSLLKMLFARSFVPLFMLWVLATSVVMMTRRPTQEGIDA